MLCIAALFGLEPGGPGSLRIWLDARALKERDAGERGQPVHQLVLESRVPGLCCGDLSLPVVPVAAAHGGGCVAADGEPCLRAIAHLQVAGGGGAASGRGPIRATSGEASVEAITTPTAKGRKAMPARIGL